MKDENKNNNFDLNQNSNPETVKLDQPDFADNFNNHQISSAKESSNFEKKEEIKTEPVFLTEKTQKEAKLNFRNLPIGDKETKFQNTMRIAGWVFMIAIILFALNSFLKFGGKYFTGLKKENVPVLEVSIGEDVLFLELADTFKRRVLGLSGRRALPEGRGILMVFDEPDRHGIWMKDMLFPIDIIWLDENFIISEFKEDVSPETFPEIFKPKSDVLFVMEVPAGSVQKYSLTTGQRIEISLDKNLDR